MNAPRLAVLALIVGLSAASGLLVETEELGRLTGVEGLELQTLDLRQRAAAAGPRERGSDPRPMDRSESSGAGVDRPEPEIVLVLFDTAAVAEWPYLSPFPRTVLADLVDALAAAGARTIGLDVYLDRLYPELNAREGGDDRLRDAIDSAGNVVLVAPVEVGPGGAELRRPHARFMEVAAGVGAAEITTPFETIRDGVLAVRSGERLEPGFALALWAHAQGVPLDSLFRAAGSNGVLRLPGMPAGAGRIPKGWMTKDAPGGTGSGSTASDGTGSGSTASDGTGSGSTGSRSSASGGGEPANRVDRGGYALSFPLRFLGPPSRTDAEGGTFPAFSASYVPLLAAASPEFFRDRIVLVGTGFHDSDRFRTPFYPVPLGEEVHGWTYGVEVHANALQNFLDGGYIHRPAWPATLLLMLAAAGLAGGTVFSRGAGWGGAAALLAAAGIVVGAFWAYTGEVGLPGGTPAFAGPYLWIPVVPPILSILLSYVGSTAYVSVVEGREKRFIRSAFGKYVPPAVVAEIAQHPDALRLGGQKRPLTVLFSDLAGFTSLAEGMEPQELIALLNEYLSEMTAVVMEEEGTLDKYIGDAVMAFWNAPKDQEDHADRALRCAVRMQERMEVLNRRWAAAGGERRFRVRIGINTGMAVVGNVGGEERFDYSAIGDAVNLAARLEPANDGYGTAVMTSAYTVDASSRERFRFRELDLIAVRGRRKPVRVFEVVGFAGATLEPERRAALKRFEAGLAAYRDRQWSRAAADFERALEADPDDGPSRIYLERVTGHQTRPPPAEWDFVVQRTTK